MRYGLFGLMIGLTFSCRAHHTFSKLQNNAGIYEYHIGQAVDTTSGLPASNCLAELEVGDYNLPNDASHKVNFPKAELLMGQEALGAFIRNNSALRLSTVDLVASAGGDHPTDQKGFGFIAELPVGQYTPILAVSFSESRKYQVVKSIRIANQYLELLKTGRHQEFLKTCGTGLVAAEEEGTYFVSFTILDVWGRGEGPVSGSGTEQYRKILDGALSGSNPEEIFTKLDGFMRSGEASYKHSVVLYFTNGTRPKVFSGDLSSNELLQHWQNFWAERESAWRNEDSSTASAPAELPTSDETSDFRFIDRTPTEISISAGDILPPMEFQVSPTDSNYDLGHPLDECIWTRQSRVGGKSTISGQSPRQGMFSTSGARLVIGTNICRVMIIAKHDNKAIAKFVKIQIKVESLPASKFGDHLQKIADIWRLPLLTRTQEFLQNIVVKVSGSALSEPTVSLPTERSNRIYHRPFVSYESMSLVPIPTEMHELIQTRREFLSQIAKSMMAATGKEKSIQYAISHTNQFAGFNTPAAQALFKDNLTTLASIKDHLNQLYRNCLTTYDLAKCQPDLIANDAAKIDPIQKPQQGDPFEMGEWDFCPAAEFNVKAEAPCPVATYATCRNATFGVESFNLNSGLECGAELFNDQHDCRHCGQVQPFRDCRSCRHESHGVERYNTCRHENFGVENHKLGSGPICGVASFQACSHPSFGIARRQACPKAKF
jgi:hypothetical protein